VTWQAERMLPSPLRMLVAPLVLACLFLTTGCGGSSDEKAEKTPAQVMASAKKAFDDASSVHIDLSTDSVPTQGNGVLGASGDVTHAPAFKGDVKVVISGLTATVPITAVDSKVFAKLPLQTKYTVIRPAEYGAPDPSTFADPDKGLSSLLTQLKGLKKGKQTRSGDTILTGYTGTLPGSSVKQIIPSADAKQDYPTVVGVDSNGQARTVRITGAFFAGSDKTTYDVKLSQYGAGVKIAAPTA
jgi:lipoprotein LprG